MVEDFESISQEIQSFRTGHETSLKTFASYHTTVLEKIKNTQNPVDG